MSLRAVMRVAAVVGVFLSVLGCCLASTEEARGDPGSSRATESCHGDDDPATSNTPESPAFTNFGTRAAYEASGANLDPRPAPPPRQGCRPVQMWFLGRHGTRLGSKADIKRMRALVGVQGKIREHLAMNRTVKLCARDIDDILNWFPTSDESVELRLTEQGQLDELHLGQRLAQRFRDLLDSGKDTAMKFKYDNSQRCKESSRWLQKGLTGSFPTRMDGIDPFPDFYHRCPAFLAPLAGDFILAGEPGAFRKGKEMSSVVTRVSSRLGFYHNLDFQEVRGMYDACSFELAKNWNESKKSPWCAVFQQDDFKVLEYLHDMVEYYRTGYGHKIHEKLGCVAIKNLVRDLQTRTDSTRTTPPSATFYSSHDTLLNQVLAFLGLYRDGSALKANNFERMEQRQWRVSKFSPFASNLMAVLHECSSGERYHVQLFLNENLLHLDGCDVNGCTWSQFMAKFGSVPDKCKQKRLCWLP